MSETCINARELGAEAGPDHGRQGRELLGESARRGLWKRVDAKLVLEPGIAKIERDARRSVRPMRPELVKLIADARVVPSPVKYIEKAHRSGGGSVFADRQIRRDEHVTALIQSGCPDSALLRGDQTDLA